MVVLTVFGALMFFGFGGIQFKSPAQKVAEEAEAEYNIAAKQGNKVQTCVQAGFVAAAYLQAKDETNYDLWKSREGADCAVASLTPE